MYCDIWPVARKDDRALRVGGKRRGKEHTNKKRFFHADTNLVLQPNRASLIITSQVFPTGSAVFIYLILLHAAVPVFVHLCRRGCFQRANNSEAQKLGIGVIPDALGQLRVLYLPRAV